jgi:ankyrin repeat protein
LAASGFNFVATAEELGDLEGNTPLHIASEKMNFEIILFLVMSGHPTTIKNKKGLKPGDNCMEARM